MASDEEHAGRSDVVFVGRVDAAPAGGRWATIVVDEVYKGDVHTYTDIVNVFPGCGVAFVRGQTLLVFAEYRPEGPAKDAPDRLTASACNGTRPVESAPIVLVASGHPPVAGTSAPADPGFPLLGWLSFVAVAGLGAVPVGLWARLRKR